MRFLFLFVPLWIACSKEEQPQSSNEEGQLDVDIQAVCDAYRNTIGKQGDDFSQALKAQYELEGHMGSKYSGNQTIEKEYRSKLRKCLSQFEKELAETMFSPGNDKIWRDLTSDVAEVEEPQQIK